MNDARLRVPLDDSYALAVGRAAYVFAYLEWQVVWCAEKLRQGFVANLETKTAGQIGAVFERLVAAITDQSLKDALLPLAQEFRSLVKKRNAILHGKPGTVIATGDQRLFCDGIAWHVSELDDASDRFAQCSLRLNAIFYGPLQTYAP